MPQFLLLLRDDSSAFSALSPEEMQAVIQRYVAWHRKVHASGHGVGGHKLRDGEGRVLRRRDGALSATDGPYAEAREVVGGLFIITAASYDEAQRLCLDHPHLDFGAIEVREIEPTA